MKKILSLSMVLAISSAAFAANSPDFDQAVTSFRKTLSEFVAADTTNPPGNESRIVAIAARILKEEGIPYEITEFASGRQNIVARLKGSGPEKPIMLLAHTDVVGTANQKWSTNNSHEVTEKDGYLIGRGVGDDLGMAVANLEVFLMLKRTGQPLRRDVILALTGDEESNGEGIRYLLKNKPETVDAAFALNEGGGVGINDDNKVTMVSVHVAEKTYEDFTLTAKGPTGHSSVPLKENAIYKLAKALDRLSQYEPEPRLLAVTRAYLAGRAKLETGKLAKAMRDLAESKGKLPAQALKEIDKNPSLAASLRTTCVATLLSAGTRVNALPAEATANVNCRVLPDETLEQVKGRLEKILADKSIEITPVLEFYKGGESPIEGEVWESVDRISKAMWPGVILMPGMSRGASDSRYLRTAGIASYGLDPIAMTEGEARLAHGIDEKIRTASIKPGLEYWHRLVVDLAGAKTLN